MIFESFTHWETKMIGFGFPLPHLRYPGFILALFLPYISTYIVLPVKPSASASYSSLSITDHFHQQFPSICLHFLPFCFSIPRQRRFTDPLKASLPFFFFYLHLAFILDVSCNVHTIHILSETPNLESSASEVSRELESEAALIKHVKQR